MLLLLLYHKLVFGVVKFCWCSSIIVCGIRPNRTFSTQQHSRLSFKKHSCARVQHQNKLILVVRYRTDYLIFVFEMLDSLSGNVWRTDTQQQCHRADDDDNDDDDGVIFFICFMTEINFSFL